MLTGKLEMLEKEIKNIKEEIKSNKKYRTALYREYGLARTTIYNRQAEIIKLIDLTNISIRHYEKILNEYNEMLKEIKKLDKGVK
jgi:DNA gyrase/topoisomerase IV subunit A